MDWLLVLANFAVFYRAGVDRLPFIQCAYLGGMASFTYMASSLVAGFIVSRRNARFFILASTALSVAGVAVCLFAASFNTMLAGMAMIGVFPALFFNSYQAFIRGESAPGGLMRTVGFYTLAWSMGMALGFISSGFLYNFGAGALALLTLVIGAAIIVSIMRHRPRPIDSMSSEEHVETGPGVAGRANSAYVFIAWLLIFTAMFVQRPLWSYFPVICAAKGIGPFIASLPLFLNFAVQGLAGWAMVSRRSLLYRRAPLVTAHLGAAALFLATWASPTLAVCFPAFSMIGVYLGFVYFSSVYYCSNSGNRVFNVAVNEFLVGTASLAGLFASELWMKVTANPAGIYAVCAAALALTAAGIALAHRLAILPGRRPA